MKTLFKAAAVAVALITTAIAGAANANVYVIPITTGSSGTQTGGFTGVVATDQLVGGFFNDSATFTLGAAGNFDSQLATILLGNTANINFTQVYLDVLDAAHTFAISIQADGTDKAVLSNPLFVNAGAHTIFVRGTLAGDIGSYGGTLNVAVPGVPEPATWAMMILGFGMVGAGMRLARTRQTAALAA